MTSRLQQKKGSLGNSIKSPPDKAASTYSSQNMYIVFSLRYLDSKYCLTKCQTPEKAAFADTLRVLGHLTWGEALHTGHNKNGYESIPRDQIKGTIPQDITEDVSFIAFRFFGKHPMVGYRENEVFHIVWLDRDFTLYEHGS